MSEVQKAVEELQKAFTDFRKANDEQLAKLEKGVNDRVGQDQVEKLNGRVGELQKSLEELDKKANRRGQTAAADEAKEAHRKAFLAFMRKGEVGPDLLKAGVNVGTDSEGGYLVPEELDRQLVEIERDNSPMRQVCSVITVSNEQYEKLVNLGGAGSGWVGELSSRTETSTPTLGSVKPAFGELYANPASTQKALDDAMIDVEAWLADEVGRQFALDENDAFTTGDGANKPKGILGYTLAATADGSRTFGQIEKMVSGTSNDFNGDNLIDLIHKLKRGYRQNAAWMMDNLTLAHARKLKDDNLNYLWQPGLQSGQPSMLLGYPVVENDDMPTKAASANAVLFGDFKRAYQICDVRGIRVLRDPYTNKPKVHFYTTKRVGGAVINDRAVKVLTLAAS